MACIMCGRAAGFNRALVDPPSGREVGRLCRNCEREHFGRRLETLAAANGSCAFCDRDGSVALPEFSARVVEKRGRLVSTNEHARTETAPRVCEHHVEAMAAFDAADRDEGDPGHGDQRQGGSGGDSGTGDSGIDDSGIDDSGTDDSGTDGPGPDGTGPDDSERGDSSGDGSR